MASRCSNACCGTDRFFSRMAGVFDRNYRKHGLEQIQRSILAGVRAQLKGGARIVDIGCGVGALHLALLKEGASHAVGIELSEGMLARAQHHAEELNLTEKTVYIRGDFVERCAEVPVADVAIMDKVVCCYPDIGELVESSMRATTSLLAITHPRNNLLARLLFKGHITLARLFRLSFHPYWHDWDAMRARILARGFTLVHAGSTAIWQALVFKKTEEFATA